MGHINEMKNINERKTNAITTDATAFKAIYALMINTRVISMSA